MNTRKHLISAHTGKLNFELARMTAKAEPGEGRAIYTVTRREIEQRDVSTFLGTFSPDRPRSELQKMLGKVVFTVAGYDDEDEPLCAIPDVRAFYTLCHHWWPCWNYFADLDSQSLKMIASSILPNISIVQSTERQELEVTLRHKELISFFESGLPSSALLHTRAGISKLTGMKLLQGVSYYLQLPDA